MKEKVLNGFEKVFGDKAGARCFFAPGRVNLIGEHTDYNGGHVFPCALTIGTYAAVKKRDDSLLRFYSLNFEDVGVIEVDLKEELKPVKERDWANYPLGIIWAFAERGMKIEKGFDIVLYGNIPNGSGLSSSASVEVLTGYILKELYGFKDVTNIDLALIGQFSENRFNGVNCGIMDQFAIAMGKVDSAIFLDTNTLKYEYTPVRLKNAKLVIACSNKKRGLGDSKYNERRAQCEEALKRIQTVKDVKTLGDLTEEEFESVRSAIGDPILEKRAKHAVYENRRTVKAVEYLMKDDIETFGKLMIDSDTSLREDYEVTGKELDTLVREALKVKGVIGSRMTGAGFGGCTVSIVKDEAVDEFIKSVGAAYKNEIGYDADFYTVNIGDGPKEI
ncbi:MAG: galactokinase [Lachnospiraceae bacterium]|nr:galactokinase [Lachnospiraceae bacterium]